MAATLAKVKALQPDILVVSGHAKGATLVTRQMEEMRVDVPMLAITHCDSADIIGNFGAAAATVLAATPLVDSIDRWTGGEAWIPEAFSLAQLDRAVRESGRRAADRQSLSLRRG